MGKNILFVCKYNRFRSKVAESIFNKYNKNKKINVKSAGLIKGSPVDTHQKKICKEKGIIIDNPSRGLSTALLKWQDVVVVVANDVAPVIFKDQKKYGKKLIVWKIKDAKISQRKEVLDIIEKIEREVLNLVKVMKNDQ